VLRKLCDRAGRNGKKAGQGFYDYPRARTRACGPAWPSSTRRAPTSPARAGELIDRLMFIQANEAARCLEESVLRSVADANIGSILGWGFAPFQGGALQFINAWALPAFVARCRELAARHGQRFAPAALLVRMAEAGERFEEGQPAT
jgi:3-hydroxyacyl-CoA dehydrogenase/enoyl-CoA hydratase/3-hydroxybutyryl-CoA epimerase